MSEERKFHIVWDELKKRIDRGNPEFDKSCDDVIEVTNEYFENSDLISDEDMQEWAEKQRKKLAEQRKNIRKNAICTSHDIYVVNDCSEDVK